MKNYMPINPKEALVYTFMMVLFMCLTMVTYNMILQNGLDIHSVKKAWLVFPIMFPLAFIYEWFLVRKFAMFMAKVFIKSDDSFQKKKFLMPFFFVLGMMFLMSLTAALLFVPKDSMWLMHWLTSMPINFVFAYLLQVFIAAPFVGSLFRKIFPVGTITVQQ